MEPLGVIDVLIELLTVHVVHSDANLNVTVLVTLVFDNVFNVDVVRVLSFLDDRFMFSDHGGLTDPELAREVIETGDVDLLTLATDALANPGWPTRVAEGWELDAFDPEETLQPDASINEFELPE